MLFAKVNLKLKGFDISRLKSDQLIEEFQYENDVYLRFYRVLDLDYFRSIHTKDIFPIKPNVIRYVEIEGTGLVRPHVDPSSSVVLNYYETAGDCITTFYSVRIGARMLNEHRENNLYRSIYKDSDLTKERSFVANDGDAYLLDVSKVHSVLSPGNKKRRFISYAWKYDSFDKVKESLGPYVDRN